MAVIRSLGIVNVSGSSLTVTDSQMISGLVCVAADNQIVIIGVAPS